MIETVKQTASLFEDYEFLIILLALFGILVGGGLIWEYFYYKPKMERINKVNGESEINHFVFSLFSHFHLSF